MPTSNPKKHLLIVEDEEQLRETLRDLFVEMGFQVDVARQGAEAIQLLNQSRPDLIISDVAMPVMDGFELLRQVKARPEGKRIPFILLTAKVANEEKMHGLGLGADDYVTKPFDLAELSLRVRNKIALTEELRASGSNSQGDEGQIQPIDSPFLRALDQYLEVHLQEGRLELKTVAENFRLSESGLQKKINRLTDKSFSKYVREYRLKKAHDLLQTNQYSIGEVADLVGFSTNSYFSESFRDLYGYVPSKLLS